MSTVLEAVQSALSDVPGDRHAKIDALELALRCGPTFQPEVFHHFAPGIYAREMRVAAGAVLVSKVHKFENLSILSKGRMALYLDNGEVREVGAGFHVTAPPGARRVAYVLEDAVWTCFHNTTETDLAVIEAQFIAQTPADYLAFTKQLEADMAIRNDTKGVQS